MNAASQFWLYSIWQQHSTRSTAASCCDVHSYRSVSTARCFSVVPAISAPAVLRNPISVSCCTYMSYASLTRESMTAAHSLTWVALCYIIQGWHFELDAVRRTPFHLSTDKIKVVWCATLRRLRPDTGITTGITIADLTGSGQPSVWKLSWRHWRTPACAA